MLSTFKRVLVGRPLATADEGHQRLIKVIALAIFASDAISSTAYATEEILHVLVPHIGMDALGYLIPISLIVMGLLAIVITSYRQTIFAYPPGGGSYVVSRDNLGETPTLVAGSSLLVDYVLTVAVSVSAGVAAITSAFPELRDHRVGICVAFIVLLTVMNLRGVKESGRVFATPTYVYVLSLGLLLGIGLTRAATGGLDPLQVNREGLAEITDQGRLLSSLTLILLMRAFSSGAVALSGIEAISNGVPAFRKPESKNAATTLVWMGVILAAFFFGISVLANHLQPTVSEDETVLSQLAGAVFGDGTVMYFVLQASTAAILILAANTAFNAFPSMGSILAQDRYLPTQLANRGDRLVFSNGIIVLATAAALLVFAFGGITTALIPLYAVGVFTGFTLSQTGMVQHHRRHRESGWQWRATVNAVGAVATGIVTLVVVVSKFTIGAWIPAVVIPIIVLLLKGVHRHYERVNARLAIPTGYRPRRHTHTVVVPVGLRVHQGVLAALTYAKSLAPDRLRAVTVVSDADEAARIQRQWEDHNLDVELHTLYSPYRELTGPVMAYLDEIDEEYNNDIITVVLPEFVLTKWYQQILHNQSALLLKARLLFRPNTVVTSVPFHLDENQQDHLFSITET